jgi:hypothetical protein
MRIRQARAYDVVSQAIDDGVATGWRRAHKHLDDPSEDTILEQIAQEVRSALCEVIDFEEELEAFDAFDAKLDADDLDAEEADLDADE